MTGAIPKYGKYFRRVSVPMDFYEDLAQRKYELRIDPYFYIRSDRSSEHWYIFYGDAREFGPYNTFTRTMKMLRDIYGVG
ncbi:MAG: hypothetical protein ACRD0E_07675 [Acidimicrobiales bacterium]